MTLRERFSLYDHSGEGAVCGRMGLGEALTALYRLLRKHPEIQAEFEEVLHAIAERRGGGW